MCRNCVRFPSSNMDIPNHVSELCSALLAKISLTSFLISRSAFRVLWSAFSQRLARVTKRDCKKDLYVSYYYLNFHLDSKITETVILIDGIESSWLSHCRCPWTQNFIAADSWCMCTSDECRTKKHRFLKAKFNTNYFFFKMWSINQWHLQ